MLELDGARLDLDKIVLRYDLPAPFGPRRGPAFLKIEARASTGQNAELRAALDKLTIEFRARQFVRDKKFERTSDELAYVSSDSADAAAIERKINELHYDHCIARWWTDIQNKGADLQTNRDNFLALAEFPHRDISRVIEKFREDLQDHSRWQSQAATELESADLGN